MMDILLFTAMAVMAVDVADASHVFDANKRYHVADLLLPRRNRISTFRTMLSLTNDIDIIPEGESFTTVHGSLRSKFKETFRGLPVIGGSIEADVDDQGVYRGGLISGNIVLDIAHDVQNIYCKYSRTKAINTVLKKEGLQKSAILDLTVMPGRIFVDDGKKGHLAVTVDMLVKQEKGLLAPFYYIGMCDGSVLKSFNRIKNVGSTETGSTGSYGTGSTGSYGTGSTGSYGTGSTGSYGTGSTGSYGTASTGSYGTGSTGSYGTGSTGSYGTGSTGSYGTGSTGSYGTGSTGSYGTGSTGSYGTGSTGSYGTGSTGSYGTGSTGSYGTGSTGSHRTTLVTSLTSGNTKVTSEAKSTTQKPTQKPPTTASPNSCSVAVGVGGNLKTGKYTYGNTKRCLTPKVTGSTCFMENEHVLTVDLKTGTDNKKRTVIEFPCSVGYQDEVNDGYSPATDAFFFGTLTQRMLKEWYGVTPLPKIAMLVHYDKKLDNAYYYNSAVMFGDGDTMFYPLTNYDTVAHEIGHGVTEKYSNLEYSGQSGGMNEAFSDIMGEAAEHFFTGNDWLSGMEDTKDPKKPLRYFEKPSLDGASIDHVKDYYTGIDVHLSSGVYNRAFYQIVKIQEVDMRYAFEAFLTANRMYWKINSNFEDGACGVMKAAYDLGLNTEKFKAGFGVVGITTCDLTGNLQMITTTKPRSNLKVTNIRQPVFGISLKSSDKSITLKTAGGKGVEMAIATSLSRDYPVATGSDSVTWKTGGKSGVVYIRLFAKDKTEISGVELSLSIQ